MAARSIPWPGASTLMNAFRNAAEGFGLALSVSWWLGPSSGARMGWYDDEEDNWLPDWAVQPIMWIGCLMAAVIPAVVVIQVAGSAWPRPPTILALSAYALSLGLMLAAVKPWRVR